jgi:hypothetical protein
VGSASARAECKPTAIAQGDPALAHTLAERLAASGIATTPAAGCPVVTVTVEPRGEQLHLSLADAFARTSERDVRDVATAAAIVESWTTQEVEAGSLPPEPARIEPVAVARSAYRGVSLAASSSLGSDGTTWVGGALAACTPLSVFCLGGALRGEADTNATGVSSPVAQDSYVLAAYATIDLPIDVSGWVASPGVGAGYGFHHVVAHHHDPLGNPLDVPTSDHQLRVAAHFGLARPFADHWSAIADLWGDLGALRSDTSFGPSASLRLSLGLRLEAP